MTTDCITKIVPVERQLPASKKQIRREEGDLKRTFISCFQSISMYFTFNYLPFIRCSRWELQLWEKAMASLSVWMGGPGWDRDCVSERGSGAGK